MPIHKQAKVVILIDFLKNDYKNIVPVAVSLGGSGASRRIIATDEKLKKHPLYRLAKSGCITYGFLDDYCNRATTSRLNKIRGIYIKKLRSLHGPSDRSRLFLYKGLSLWDCEAGDFDGLMGIKRVSSIIKRSIEFETMLDIEAPDLLVFSDEQGALGRFYARSASRRNIPYLCLPDLGDQLLQNIPIQRFEKRSRYAILGMGMQKVLRRQGVALSHLTKTGSVLADTYSFTRPHFTCREILSRLNHNRYKRFFLFAMQDSLPENKRILQALIVVMRALPDKCLIVRPHPKDRGAKKYYALIRNADAGNVIISKRFEINDLICASEMVITVFSLSGFHAIVKNKPLISINLSPFPDNMPYAEYGAAIGVYRVEDLQPAIKSVLSSESTRRKLVSGRKRLLHDYPASNSSVAKGKIVDLAEACVKKNTYYHC